MLCAYVYTRAFRRTWDSRGRIYLRNNVNLRWVLKSGPKWLWRYDRYRIRICVLYVRTAVRIHMHAYIHVYVRAPACACTYMCARTLLKALLVAIAMLSVILDLHLRLRTYTSGIRSTCMRLRMGIVNK